MDPVKLKAIKDWKAPTKPKEVRSFLGFCNFYRKFIAKYTEMSRHLTALTKQDVPFNWKPEHEKAFEELKQQFMKLPVLIMPNNKKETRLDCNASNYTASAILSQKDNNREWHPCGFSSHTFSETERNWPIYDKELYAILHRLTEWRYICEQNPYPVIVYINCSLNTWRQ